MLITVICQNILSRTKPPRLYRYKDYQKIHIAIYCSLHQNPNAVSVQSLLYSIEIPLEYSCITPTQESK